MTELIGSVAALLTQIFKLINTKESRKYLDQLVELQKDVLEEESKSYDQQNDAKVVQLRAELKIISDAAQQELTIWQAQKNS